MAEADFAGGAARAGRPQLRARDGAWVHGTRELPLADLLEAGHLRARWKPAQLQQRLGVRAPRNAAAPSSSRTCCAAAPPNSAGLAANDEWLGVEVAGTAWRMAKLDDLLLYAGTHRKVIALVARDRRLLRLELHLPAA
jgi:predicted metalloprotease with PDZ domain